MQKYTVFSEKCGEFNVTWNTRWGAIDIVHEKYSEENSVSVPLKDVPKVVQALNEIYTESQKKSSS